MLGKLFKRKKKQEGAEEANAPENEEENKKGKTAEAGEDAESAEGAGGENPELVAKKKKRKKLMLIGFVIFMLIAIGGGAYVFLQRSKQAAEVSSEATAANGQSGGTEMAETVYYTLPEFLVNLNTTSKQASFLKMTVVLQVKSQEDAKKVEVALPRVLDNMNTYLREMRATDLSGSAGIYRLRDELLVRVNKTVAPVKVDDVLFREIIVQ